MKNGDVLLLLGSVGKKINKTTGKISKSFRPFTVSITKSDCKIAFDNVFDGMILAIDKLTDLAYIPPGDMIQDYCRASKNSYEQTMIPAMLEFNKTYDDSRDHDTYSRIMCDSCHEGCRQSYTSSWKEVYERGSQTHDARNLSS